MSETEWLEIFGQNLLQMLADRRITQKELAYFSDISQGTISKYIHGDQMPGVKAILNISYVLGCELEELIDFGTKIR